MHNKHNKKAKQTAHLKDNVPNQLDWTRFYRPRAQQAFRPNKWCYQRNGLRSAGLAVFFEVRHFVRRFWKNIVSPDHKLINSAISCNIFKNQVGQGHKHINSDLRCNIFKNEKHFVATKHKYLDWDVSFNIFRQPSRTLGKKNEKEPENLKGQRTKNRGSTGKTRRTLTRTKQQLTEDSKPNFKR